MSRIFADLRLRLNPKDLTGAKRIVTKAAELGYSLIAVPFAIETQEKEITNFRKICDEVKIDFSPRVDLIPKSRNQLMFLLRKLRRKFEIMCVVCENKEIARQAAKDRRVDLINFASLNYRNRFFDWAEAELAHNSLAALEVDFKPLLMLEGPARVRLLSTLHREISIAKEFHVPVVVSSDVEKELLLRRPREIAAFISLLGLNENLALDVVSTNPFGIVLRNREKLSHGFVAPGISVVREGSDC